MPEAGWAFGFNICVAAGLQAGRRAEARRLHWNPKGHRSR